MRNLLRDFRSKIRVRQVCLQVNDSGVGVLKSSQRILRDGKEYSPYGMEDVIVLPDGTDAAELFPQMCPASEVDPTSGTACIRLEGNEVIALNVEVDIESLAREAHDEQEAGVALDDEEPVGSGAWPDAQSLVSDTASVASWDSMHAIPQVERKERDPAAQNRVDRTKAKRRKGRQDKQSTLGSPRTHVGEAACDFPPKRRAMKHASETTVIQTDFDIDGGQARYAGAGFTGKVRPQTMEDQASVPFEQIVKKLPVLRWGGRYAPRTRFTGPGSLPDCGHVQVEPLHRGQEGHDPHGARGSVLRCDTVQSIRERG